MRRTLFLTFLFAAVTLSAAPPQQIERGGHYVLEPQHALQPGEVAALESEGMTIQRAMGGNRFLVLVRDGAELAGDARVRSLQRYDWTHKIARGAYAEAAKGRTFPRLRVLFHDDVSFDDAREAIELAGGVLESPLEVDYERPRVLTARIPASELQTLARDERVFGVYGPPLRVQSNNAVAAQMSKVTPLFSAPYNLSGDGVVLSLFELATAETAHPQFQGRMTAHFSLSNPSNALHSTHVAGTMISAGIEDARNGSAPNSKGMAPKATLHEYLVTGDFDALLNLKGTALTPLSIAADNNSWDFALGWQLEGVNWVWNGDFFGGYDGTYSTPYEAITVKNSAPLFVHASGNDADRGDPGLVGLASHLHCCNDSGNTITNETFCYSPSGSGTDCTAPCSPGTSTVTGEAHCEKTKHPVYGPFGTIGFEASLKNVLSVGAMDSAGTIASFSSRGPTLDGRLKPELSAKGVTQFSTVPGGYANRSGTSMSSPVVTGIAGLLTEQWRKTFGGQNPSGVVLKTLLIAGADDQVGSPSVDPPGPDFTYGYGLVDAKNSVDLIIADAGTGSRIRTGTLGNGSVEFPLAVAVPQNVRVTLGWFDPEILPSPDDLATPTLLNDLDLKVIDPSGATVLPYVLDKDHPSALATRGVNTVDTTEMVEIKNAAAGQYRVIVTAKLGSPAIHPSQDFVLVSNGSLTASVVCIDSFEPNDSDPTSFKFLGNGQTITAKTCSATDLDFYSVNVSKAGPLSVTVTSTDTPLRLTVSGAGVTTLTVDVPAQSTRLLSATVPVGQYTIKVEPAGAVGSSATYTLRATFSEATTARHRSVRH